MILASSNFLRIDVLSGHFPSGETLAPLTTTSAFCFLPTVLNTAVLGCSIWQLAKYSFHFCSYLCAFRLSPRFRPSFSFWNLAACSPPAMLPHSQASLMPDSLYPLLSTPSCRQSVRRSVLHFYLGTFPVPFKTIVLHKCVNTFGLRIEKICNIQVDFPCLLGTFFRKNNYCEFCLPYMNFYLFFFESLCLRIIHHIALDLQFFVKLNNSFFDLFPLPDFCGLLTYIWEGTYLSSRKQKRRSWTWEPEWRFWCLRWSQTWKFYFLRFSCLKSEFLLNTNYNTTIAMLNSIIPCESE